MSSSGVVYKNSLAVLHTVNLDISDAKWHLFLSFGLKKTAVCIIKW